MNQWVYDGFEVTYRNLGVSFDRNYYESETYLLGKDIVQRGLEQGVFYRKEDGSVWIDLTADGLDEKARTPFRWYFCLYHSRPRYSYQAYRGGLS